MELPENYQKLIMAIIKQAVQDYRESREFLRDHPKTDELVRIVSAQVEQRRKRQERRRMHRLPAMPEKRSREEKLLRSILKSERMLDDTVRFFRSEWFYAIANADGNAVLNKLKEEFK